MTHSKTLTLIGLVAMLLLLSCTARRIRENETIQSNGSALMPFQKRTLSNGLDVIVKETSAAPLVAVYLWCNTGSVNEPERVQGISHFYEHMFFKGTEKRGVGEIDIAIKRLGGYNNAFTSNEYTAYYVVLPSENFSLAADVLIDAVRNSKFPQDEIVKESGVIKEEINRKEDTPTGLLYERLFSEIFKGSPYAHSVLGTKETVSAITREDFREYLSRFYVPNNMSIVVVGDIDADKAFMEIERLTSDWKRGEVVEKSIKVPGSNEFNKFEIEKDVNATYAIIAFPTSGLKDSEENISLDVASTILGEGRSSRLYRRLVDKERIVSSVQAFIYPFKNTGILAVMATLESDKIEDFKKAVLEETKRIGEVPVDADELKKAKTMLKAGFEFGNETASDIARSLGYYNTLGLLDQAVEYERRVDAVRAEDILKYAGRVINSGAYKMGVVKPSTGKENR